MSMSLPLRRARTLALTTPALFLLVLLAALLPRVFTLDRPLTVDEAYFWQNRSATFLQALTNGNFADTIITGHPGVTTMWLGSFGILLERALQALGLIGPATPPMHLGLLRLPVACASSLAIAGGFVLLRRILSAGVALLAALLWASDPFLVAHTRLLHVDGVLTVLMLVALLAMLAACFGHTGARVNPGRWTLALAGVATGLALVTKAPGMLLLPCCGLVLLVWAWLRRRAPGMLRAFFLAGLLWLGVALLAAFAAWPALWVAPVRAITSVVNEMIVNGGTEHPHNFLLGSPDHDPGALFYPVTLLARTTPWTGLGLLALLVALARRWEWLRGRGALLLLLAFIALFVVGVLSAAPKKFDRYALPAIPLLLVLAACGLAWLGGLMPGLLRQSGVLVLTLMAATTLLLIHPYYLAYYSPLIGGSAGAVKAVPIGWGEGLDLAADWLNAQPDIAQSVVGTWSPPSIQAYLNTTATWQELIDTNRADYLVVYLYQVQTGGLYFGEYHPACTPLHTVRIAGIDYVWIYKTPRRQVQPLAARFGDAFAVNSFSVLPPNTACGASKLALTLGLQPLARPAQALNVFVHIIGAGGPVAQFDFPLDALLPPAQWGAGETIEQPLELPLPADIASGKYQIFVGSYDPASGQRLPLQTTAPAHGADGPDALLVAQFSIQQPEK